MNTAIVIGNGFDIDLGWKTSYKEFYDAHKGWSMHKRDEDDLFQYVINHAAENWFDFERTIYEYVISRNKIKLTDELVSRDLNDFHNYKGQLKRFLQERSQVPVRENSFAFKLLKAYISQCKRYNNMGDRFLKFFSFNYTPLNSIAQQIDPDYKFSYVPVHGTIENDSIIFGVHDDQNILPQYRDVQKSMDDKYESHGIVSALIDADLIIFFGSSMGFIDAVYIKDMFQKASETTNSQYRKNKEIVFITKDSETKKSIKNNLQDMGLNTQILFNMSTIDFIYTSCPDGNKIENNNKFLSLLNKL